MLKLAAVFSGAVLFALAASYAMTRASSRSPFWNMGAAGVAVIVFGVLLLLITLVMVRMAFG